MSDLVFIVVAVFLFGAIIASIWAFERV